MRRREEESIIWLKIYSDCPWRVDFIPEEQQRDLLPGEVREFKEHRDLLYDPSEVSRNEDFVIAVPRGRRAILRIGADDRFELDVGQEMGRGLKHSSTIGSKFLWKKGVLVDSDGDRVLTLSVRRFRSDLTK